MNILSQATNFLVEKNMLSKELAPWFTYSLAHYCLSAFTYTALLIIGTWLAGLVPTALYLVFFALLRRYSGGWHAGSALKCFFSSCLSVFLFLGIIYPLLLKISDLAVVILSVFALISVFLLAPQAPTQLHAQKNELLELKKRARVTVILQIAFIALIYLFYNPSLALSSLMGMCCAALSLIISKIKK